MATTRIPPFVSAHWLDEHRGAVTLADTRWYLDGRSGFDAYRRGHLPGAVFVDLDRWLSGPAAGGARHPLPDPETFAEGMSQLGIGDDSTVVAYDDAGGVIAARLVWMLRVLGRSSAILDGGIGNDSGPLETAVVDPVRASFTVTPWPAERIASIDDACRSDGIVLDARNRDRYRGEHEPVDPRAGHIPGALNLPCRENVDSCGRLIDAAEIHRKYAAAGVFEAPEVISYCGSGVTACHTLLTLDLVGVNGGKLFPGSWSEYSTATDRPVATGTL